MVGSLMLKNFYAEQDGRPKSVLVDCGYCSSDTARAAWEALTKAGVSPRRFVREGNDRLLVEIPVRKAPSLLSAHPIHQGGKYWQTTHHWEGVQ